MVDARTARAPASNTAASNNDEPAEGSRQERLSHLVLRHYAARPLERVESVYQWERSPTGFHKPVGLWVSVENFGDGWKEWCEGENWGLDSLTHAHEITLADDAQILWLRCGRDIDAFHQAYSSGARWGAYPDWTRVAGQYQGIIIAPYIWARRLEGAASQWYYAWDCASGCIWDARAIVSISPLLDADARGGQPVPSDGTESAATPINAGTEKE